jgi:hypothetical protein
VINTDDLQQAHSPTVESVEKSESAKMDDERRTEKHSAVPVPESVGEQRQEPALPSAQPVRSVTGRVLTHFELAPGFNFKPNQVSRSYEPASESSPILGLTYQISEHVAIGFEGGRAVLTQQRTETRRPSPVPQMAPAGEWSSLDSRVEYTSSYSDREAIWSLAIVRYTFNPANSIRIEATGGAGAAFVEGPSPMIALGVSGSYDVSRILAITTGVSARGAWLSGADHIEAPSQARPGEAIGIVNQAQGASTVFSPSIGLRLGLRVSLQ